jgi:hypothetical protein
MSATLDTVFRDALAAALPGAYGDLFSWERPKAAPKLQLLAAAPTDDFPVTEVNNTTRNRVKDAIFKASRAAYVDMKRDMSPKLVRAKAGQCRSRSRFCGRDEAEQGLCQGDGL